MNRKYDFDTPVNRKGTDAIKWDVPEGELPMWVADMDFRTAPEIIEALKERCDHGVFGYANVPEEWYQAYISWWERRHHFTMDKDWLIFCTGVIPAISSIVRKLTTPNENVVVLTPIYNTFFNSIINNGARDLQCPLIEENGVFRIDYAALEEKLANPQTSLMIFCNPHNPVGKIWDEEDLRKVGELCAKHHVVVVADEIHCDITRPGTEYTPFASVSDLCRDNSITCIAPSKTFNMAGMQSAACVVPNPVLRHKVWRALNTDEVAEPNSFATLACITAFNKGEEWVKQLNEYVFENRRMVEEYIEKNLPMIKVTKADATYLLWLDIREIQYPGSTLDLALKIRELTGLYLLPGHLYGEAGEGFLRMNVACPKSYVEDGLERLNKAVSAMRK